MSKLRAFTMPKWGIEMLEGTISEWNIAAGEAVAKGQTIAQIETDKIVNELVVEYDATVARLIGEVGETYPVGALLGVMAIGGEASQEEVDAFVREFQEGRGTEPAAAGSAVTDEAAAQVAAATAAPPAAAARTASAAAPSAQAAIPPLTDTRRISRGAHNLAARLGLDISHINGSGRSGRITLQDVDQASKPARQITVGTPVSIQPTSLVLDAFYASTFAKRLAVQHSVDLSAIQGTGPRGRISRADVMRAAGIAPALARGAAGTTVTRMSPTRRAIARQLTHAKATIPHFYLRVDVKLDELVAARAERKRRDGSAPSINDYLIKASALALIEVPEVNIQVHGEEIHRFHEANIAVAVATERGLMTPVLRSAQSKSLAQLSRELRTLIESARTGKLTREDIQDGSFTVSNLGMYGVDQFDAIINPPQGAILAIGATRRVAMESNGTITFGSVACLSLSCDHRAIDGAVGATFLAALKKHVESPESR